MNKYEKILERLFTTEHANELLVYLDQLLKEPYLLNHLTSSINSGGAELKALFDSLGFTQEDFYKLKEVILSASKIEISLPFIPDDSFIEKLHALFVSTECRNFLLETKLDETLFAGCTVALNGKFIDASISPKIEKFLEKK